MCSSGWCSDEKTSILGGRGERPESLAVPQLQGGSEVQVPVDPASVLRGCPHASPLSPAPLPLNPTPLPLNPAPLPLNPAPFLRRSGLAQLQPYKTAEHEPFIQCFLAHTHTHTHTMCQSIQVDQPLDGNKNNNNNKTMSSFSVLNQV